MPEILKFQTAMNRVTGGEGGGDPFTDNTLHACHTRVKRVGVGRGRGQWLKQINSFFSDY